MGEGGQLIYFITEKNSSRFKSSCYWSLDPCFASIRQSLFIFYSDVEQGSQVTVNVGLEPATELNN